MFRIHEEVEPGKWQRVAEYPRDMALEARQHAVRTRDRDDWPTVRLLDGDTVEQVFKRIAPMPSRIKSRRR